ANTYPGAACDVPSHLYEFSFAPNPGWSRRYAPQGEIQAYLEEVARSHGVLERIRTGVEVTHAAWDEQRGRWTLQTNAGAHEAEDGLRLLAAHPAPVRALSAAAAAGPRGGLRVHGAGSGRDDRPALADRSLPRRRASSDQQGDRRRGLARQGDPGR